MTAITSSTSNPTTSTSITHNNKIQTNQNNKEKEEEEQIIRSERKIAIATEGLIDFVIKKLRSLDNNNTKIIESVGKQNIEAICDYFIAMKAEVNPTIMRKKKIMQVLCYLSEHHNNLKPFKEMTSNDILSYLDSLRKPLDML
jgi:hypothetical protein